MSTLDERIGTTDAGRGTRPIGCDGIPSKLRDRAPFQSRSMSAQRETDGAYVVYSYATVIATVSPDGDVSIIDRNLWGRTTGRHINLCRSNLR